MIIRCMDLADFRNYDNLHIDFDQNINIFYGDNAQGKTNMLEAIYLCGTTKSHRADVRDRDMIRFGSDESHLKMTVDRDGSAYRIDMHIKKSKNKGIAINSIPIKKASELFGIVNLIFFSPEDLQIIKDGPAQRRRFIDLELCQLDKIYMYNLVNYNKVIAQRNLILKDAYPKNINDDFDKMLSIYDEQMDLYGSKIIEIRKSFVKELNEIIEPIHRQLTGGKEKLNISYEYNVQEHKIADELFVNRDRDMRLKTTTVGPHRDDIKFSIESDINNNSQKIDIRRYGSQGQQRSAALSLKMAEIEIVKIKTKEMPILLLDDVLSELDSNRQNQLLNSIKGIQTFITCTGLDDFVNNRFHMDKIFYVENGTIVNKSK